MGGALAPPLYNFADLPVVSSRHPLWTPGFPDSVVTGLRDDVPEVLVTRILDAEPDHCTQLPAGSVWPFFTAIGLGIGVIGSIFTPWGAVVGTVPCIVALVGWFWPTPPHHQLLAEQP